MSGCYSGDYRRPVRTSITIYMIRITPGTGGGQLESLVVFEVVTHWMRVGRSPVTHLCDALGQSHHAVEAEKNTARLESGLVRLAGKQVNRMCNWTLLNSVESCSGRADKSAF